MSKQLVGSIRFFAMLILVGWALIQTGLHPVSAHSPEVVDSNPKAGATLEASPSEVKVWFSEELDPKSTVKVLDYQGQPVDQGKTSLDLDDPNHAAMVVTLPASLPDGTYTVKWTVVLLDGDASEGEFSFIVGAPSPADFPAKRQTTSLVWFLVGGGVLLLTAGAIFLIYKR